MSCLQSCHEIRLESLSRGFQYLEWNHLSGHSHEFVFVGFGKFLVIRGKNFVDGLVVAGQIADKAFDDFRGQASLFV